MKQFRPKRKMIMTTITIALPEDVMNKLQALAERHRVAPEDLVRASVEELVASPEESFQETMNYVLEKNTVWVYN